MFAVPGRDHVGALGGDERPAAARRDAADGGRGRARVFGLSSAPRPSRSSSARRRRRCSRACATARRPPTSSRARPGSTRARWRRRSPSSSWPAARSRGEVCTGRTSIDDMADSYWLDEPSEPLPRGSRDGARRRRRRRRRRHRLLVRAHARRGRAARARARGAAGRVGRERPQRRLRAPRRRDAVPDARERFGRERAAELLALDRALPRPAGGARRRRAPARRQPAARPTTRSWTTIRAEYEALREDGFDAEWLDELGRRSRALPRRDRPPAATGRSSLPAGCGGSRRVRPRPARRSSRRARVESLDELDADHVVIATDGYTSGLLPELDGAIGPSRGQVIVDRAARGDAVSAPALRAARLRLLAADTRRPPRPRRPPRHEPRDRVHGRGDDHGADPGRRSSLRRPSSSASRRGSSTAGRASSARPTTLCRSSGAFPAARASGSRPATRATATSSASPAASSWRGRSWDGLRQSSSCFDPARLL